MGPEFTQCGHKHWKLICNIPQVTRGNKTVLQSSQCHHFFCESDRRANICIISTKSLHTPCRHYYQARGTTYHFSSGEGALECLRGDVTEHGWGLRTYAAGLHKLSAATVYQKHLRHPALQTWAGQWDRGQDILGGILYFSEIFLVTLALTHWSSGLSFRATTSSTAREVVVLWTPALQVLHQEDMAACWLSKSVKFLATSKQETI